MNNIRTRARTTKPVQTEPIQLVDVKFLAKRYGVSTKAIQKWARKGLFPVVKLSRRCARYPLAACDKIIASRTIQSND